MACQNIRTSSSKKDQTLAKLREIAIPEGSGTTYKTNRWEYTRTTDGDVETESLVHHSPVSAKPVVLGDDGPLWERAYNEIVLGHDPAKRPFIEKPKGYESGWDRQEREYTNARYEEYMSKD